MRAYARSPAKAGLAHSTTQWSYRADRKDATWFAQPIITPASGQVVSVHDGDRVLGGQHVATCGNSGNSTQPHLHIQAMDRADPFSARWLPMVFTGYRSWPRRGLPPSMVDQGMPGESEVVERA
jgi:hypothetical protein